MSGRGDITKAREGTTMHLSESEVRQQAELRARQGTGARYDTDHAPHEDLLMARRGTAHFARVLNELSDRDLLGTSRRPGWTCARIVAEVSFHARSLSQLLAGARAGSGRIAENSDAGWMADIDLGASLPARALRHLFHHSAVHLDVEWRDLPDECWNARLNLESAETMIARETPHHRAIELRNAAVDLTPGHHL